MSSFIFFGYIKLLLSYSVVGAYGAGATRGLRLERLAALFTGLLFLGGASTKGAATADATNGRRLVFAIIGF